MEVRHEDSELEKIEFDENYNGKMDHKLARCFRKVMNIVRSVDNETELYNWRSLNFEKLKGKRCDEYSLRLNDQWRLIVEIEHQAGSNANICVVISIEDYH